MKRFLNNKQYEYLLFILFSICLLVIAFYPAVFNNQIIYLEDPPGSDSLDHNAVKRCLAVQSLLKYGEFPLWEPRISCGYPLFAESEAGVFHPTILFYFLTNITTATNLTVLSAILTAMLGSFAWSRCLGLNVLSSVISSLIYGFGTIFLGQTQALNILHVMALLPVSLTLIHLGTVNKSNLYWYGLVVVWTGQLFASHFETFAICQICCWIYILWISLSNNVSAAISKYKIVLWSLFALLLTVLIGTVQLLSTYEFVHKSSRKEAASLEWIQHNTSVYLDPIRFVDPFCPIKNPMPSGANGSEHMLEKDKSGLVLEKFYLDNNRQYIGVFALLLCLYSFSKKRQYMVVSLWCMALFFFIASLGPKYGLFYLFWRFVPFMDSFRYANRYVIPMLCILSILAAIGAQNLWELLNKYFNSRIAYCVLIIIVLCICAERVSLNYRIQAYLPASWSNPPQVLSTMVDHQRVFSIFSFESNLLNIFRFHSAEDRCQYQKRRQNIMWLHRSLLSPGMAALWDVDAPDDYLFHIKGIILGISDNIQRALHGFARGITHSEPELVRNLAPKYDKWLRLLGVTHIISPVPLPESWPKSEFSSIYSVPIAEMPRQQVFVYVLANPVKKVRLVPSLQKHVPEDSIDFERSLQIHTGSLYEPSFSNPADIGQVVIDKATNHTMSVRTKCVQDAYLVISSTYDSNWQAAVDGQPSEIRLTNLSMQSVFVPKGQHRIELRYVSPAFELGWKISLISLIIFIGLGICAVFRESQRNADS